MEIKDVIEMYDKIGSEIEDCRVDCIVTKIKTELPKLWEYLKLDGDDATKAPRTDDMLEEAKTFVNWCHTLTPKYREFVGRLRRVVNYFYSAFCCIGPTNKDEVDKVLDEVSAEIDAYERCMDVEKEAWILLSEPNRYAGEIPIVTLSKAHTALAMTFRYDYVGLYAGDFTLEDVHRILVRDRVITWYQQYDRFMKYADDNVKNAPMKVVLDKYCVFIPKLLSLVTAANNILATMAEWNLAEREDILAVMGSLIKYRSIVKNPSREHYGDEFRKFEDIAVQNCDSEDFDLEGLVDQAMTMDPVIEFKKSVLPAVDKLFEHF